MSVVDVTIDGSAGAANAREVYGAALVELAELLASSNLLHHGTSAHELFDELSVTPEIVDDLPDSVVSRRHELQS